MKEGKMKHLLAAPLCLALIAAAPPPATVIAATGDWSNLPPIGQTDTLHQSKNLMLALDEIASKHECDLPGYNGRRFNFKATFAAQFGPDGTLQKLVVPKLNCPKAEAALGGALKEMIEGGDYRPTGQSPAGWYQGQFSFDIDEASK
jgi:hypothetical protein